MNWLPGFKGRLGHVFPHEAELEEKRAEMADLEASLAATPDGATPAEADTGLQEIDVLVLAPAIPPMMVSATFPAMP